jgi:hypothetical protein
MLLGNVVDQLHDKHSLSDSGSSEETNLTSTSVGVKKINNLDTGHKDLSLGLLLGESGGVSMNGKMLSGVDGTTLINGISITLTIRPRRPRPTGTIMGAPVSVTVCPRTRPSVASIAMVRTVFSPKC